MPGAPIAIALPTKTNLYSDRALGEKHSKTRVPPGTHRYPPAGPLAAKQQPGGAADPATEDRTSWPVWPSLFRLLRWQAEDPR